MSKEDKWKKFYLNQAREYAKEWSKSPRLQVCAIVVAHDYSKPLSIGLNGWEDGGTNTPDSDEPGKDGALHAEINCFLKLDAKPNIPAKMFLTHNPCRVCARAIVNVGCISEVYYGEEYRDTSGIEILRARGIHCEKIT